MFSHFSLAQKNLTLKIFKITKNTISGPSLPLFLKIGPMTIFFKIDSRHVSGVTPMQKIKKKLMTKDHTSLRESIQVPLTTLKGF